MGPFMCFLKDTGVRLRRREESATFLRCCFLLSFRVFAFWVKVNASKCGLVLRLLYSLNLIYLHGWICILVWFFFFDFLEPPQIKFKCGLNSNEDFFFGLARHVCDRLSGKCKSLLSRALMIVTRLSRCL